MTALRKSHHPGPKEQISNHEDGFDLMTVVGNRPQFVKMAPLSAELARRGHRELVVHTGQHFDENMSDVFFSELELPRPDIRFQSPHRTHGAMTAEMLCSLERVMIDRKPPFVLIFGDTNSTLAAALAAVKLRIPVAHVEAGPRIYDIDIPEEINRIVADHASRLKFCPDIPSVSNLARENMTDGVYYTGDVMYDAFLQFSGVAERRSTVFEQIMDEPFALLTIHRPNNTDTKPALTRIVQLLSETPISIVFPVHPRTEAALKRHGLWETVNALPRARILPAVGYLDILQLINHAEIVLTDSGGLQKEAVYGGKPALVLFYVSPWPQLINAGWIQCCWKDEGIDVPQILNLIEQFRPQGSAAEIFGDGHAAKRIVDVLERHNWLTAKQPEELRYAG